MEDFKSVVKGIEKSEKHVDKVLRAARLKRVESGRMTDERLEMILGYVLAIIGILAFAFLIFCFMYFTKR